MAVIKDTLVRLNLKIQHCRGQCYDGASSTCGIRKGVANKLLDEEPRAVFTHCYGHTLNLTVGDCVKQCKVMKMALDVVAEVSKPIKKSPKRDAAFDNSRLTLLLKHQGFLSCVQMHWTVRAVFLQSVTIDNYEVFLQVWQGALNGSLDGETHARIIGVEAQMIKFDFLFGVFLGSLILRPSDYLIQR